MATQRLVVGRIGRAHGIRGDVTVDVRTDEPQRRFAAGSSVFVDSEPKVIVASRSQKDRWVIRFEGTVDRTAAEALRHGLVEVEVDVDEIHDDGYYDHQLIGLQVVSDGARRGEVEQVEHRPVQDLLVVRLSSGGLARVPFVEALVPEVDLDAATITVVDRPGLLQPDEAVVADPKDS